MLDPTRVICCSFCCQFRYPQKNRRSPSTSLASLLCISEKKKRLQIGIASFVWSRVRLERDVRGFLCCTRMFWHSVVRFAVRLDLRCFVQEDDAISSHFQ